MSRLKDFYEAQIVPEMTKKFSYTNKLAVPKLEKIIINSGTVLTRSYAPVISRDEYFGNTCTDILGDGQKSALIASLIDTETDLDELEHLEEMIAQRKHILINGGN